MKTKQKTTRLILLIIAGYIIISSCVLANTNTYHFYREFTPITFTNNGDPTLYEILTDVKRLTRLVGPTNIITNAISAREYEGVSLVYTNAEKAWDDVLHLAWSGWNYTGRNYTNHPDIVYDNAGWVKGTYQIDNTWASFLWYLQNNISFESSPSVYYTNASGNDSRIVRVLVGNVGDYNPQITVNDVGPHLDTNFPGINSATTVVHQLNLDTYYKLELKEFFDINDSDEDSDGIPGFADGFNRFTNTTNDDSSAGSVFYEWRLDLPCYIDVSNTTLQFYYPSSDPMQVSRSGTPSNYTYTPATGSLRIWTKNGHYPRNGNTISNSGDYIASETYNATTLGFTPTNHTRYLYVEAIQPGLNQQITVYYYTNSWNSTCLDIVNGTLINPRLVPDFNHDREITETDYSEYQSKGPYRFWINDDDDDSADAKTGSDDDKPGAADPDAGDSQVDGERDLIDFFPLFVDLKDTLDVLGTTDYSYVLDYEGIGSVGIIYTELTPDTAGEYLSDADTAEDIADETVEQISGLPGGHTLSQTFLDNIQNNDQGILLVEFSHAGPDPLRLEIRDSSDTVIHSVDLHVNLSGVEDMFRLVNLVDHLDAAETQTVTVVERKGEPANLPNSLCSPDNFVFIHGFEVDQQASRIWHCETFKRLYWSGSKAKFTGIIWHGKTDNYHKAVINAFTTSKCLASQLSFLTGDITIGAHSLGNIVVSSAIQDYGFTPTRYFLFNAAAAISAYDANQTLNQHSVTMLDYMTHPDWDEYTNRLWASYWHELFSPTDHRNELTWEDRFANVAQYAYNFYSEGEDIVRNADTTVWGMIGAQFNWPPDFNVSGEYAWPMQELIKGLDGPIGMFAYNLVIPDQHAGWAFNPVHDTNILLPGTQPPDPADAELWTDVQLRTAPLFETFIPAGQGEADRFPNYDGPAMLAPDNDPTASAQAGLEETQFKVLAEAIPALTFAAAANQVPRFDPPVGDSHNFHMQDYRDSTKWPSVRTGNSTFNTRWLHSDLKDMAYSYISEFYDQVVLQGGLK